MNIFRTFWVELSWLVRHKGALMILIGAPLIYSVFYPLPYQLAIVEDVPVVIWDADNSAESRDWAMQLDATPQLKVIARLPGEPNEADWQQYSQAQAFVAFPEGAKEQLSHQQQVTVAYGGKADNFLVYSTASKAIALVLADINAQWSLQYLYLSDANAVTAEQTANIISSDVIPIFNDNSSYMQYLVPTVFILIVQQVVMISVGMHWAYRFELNRPIGGAFAVWNAHLWIYTIQGLALVLFFFRWALPWQSVEIPIDNATLIQTALPFVMGSVGMGMVITYAMREQETAIVWLLPLSVPLLLLTGMSWPQFAMNEWLQVASYWLPSNWGVNALIDAAFLQQAADIAAGWKVALFWLSFSLLLRISCSAHDTQEETDQSTA